MTSWMLEIFEGWKESACEWLKGSGKKVGSFANDSLWYDRKHMAIRKVSPDAWRMTSILQLVRTSKVRSGYLWWFKDLHSGITYPMMHTEFNDIVQREGVAPGGFIQGTFAPIKRGDRVGIKIVREGSPERDS